MKVVENTVKLKKRVMENLEKVSENDIQEISDFVELIRRRRYKGLAKNTRILPKRDPILKLMGIASVEPFAEQIDQELYG
jgi:hypothetical protein